MYVYAAQKSFECVFHHHLLLKPHKFLKHIGHVQRVLFLALTGHFGFVSDLTGLRIEPKETGKAAGHLREIYRPSGRRPRGGPCSPWAFSGLLPLGRLLGRIVGFPLIRVAQSFVGLINILELGLCLRIVWVQIRVQLLGQLSVRFFLSRHL